MTGNRKSDSDLRELARAAAIRSFRDRIVVSISACHAEGLGSIPSRGDARRVSCACAARHGVRLLPSFLEVSPVTRNRLSCKGK